MVKKIVYTNNEGNVVADSIDTRQDDQVYIDRMVSRGFADAVVIDSSTFPSDRFNEAWTLSGSTISVNMTTAKESHRNNLRNQRKQYFSETDSLLLETFSQKKGLEEVKSRQQYLRNITEDPAIDAATTTTELNAVTIVPWDTKPIAKILEQDVLLFIKENDPESSTTSKSYKRKSRLTFTSKAGDYLITYSAEVRNTNRKGKCKINVLLDSTELNKSSGNPDPIGAEYCVVSGSSVKTLTAGSHDIDISYATTKGACFIRRARIQAMEIS